LKPKAKNKFHRRKPTYIYYYDVMHVVAPFNLVVPLTFNELKLV
jgi:hypothetical protein